MRERLGVFGGTFDPIHVGHVVAAVEVRSALRLDRVLVVVAGDPWQKRGRDLSPARDRLAMAAAALDGVAGVEASDLEILRPGPSVTAATLEELARPDRDLFLVLGADAVANLPSWRRLEETRHLATLVAVERAGEHAEPPGAGWCVEHLPIPRLDVSSSDVRARVAGGRPIDGMVPPGVVRLIRERGLYTRAR